MLIHVEMINKQTNFPVDGIDQIKNLINTFRHYELEDVVQTIHQSTLLQDTK